MSVRTPQTDAPPREKTPLEQLDAELEGIDCRSNDVDQVRCALRKLIKIGWLPAAVPSELPIDDG